MSAAVSVVIPTKNEARNIERCLRSVRWASEIYLIDSQSTDDTCRIATKFGAKVVQFDYQGGWPKKKNWALANVPFENDWVLLLDADEVLMEEGQEEIEAAVQSEASIDGYWINRRFVFLDKWLKHSYYPTGTCASSDTAGVDSRNWSKARRTVVTSRFTNTWSSRAAQAV